MARRYDNQGRDQYNIENYVVQDRSRKRPDQEMIWLKAFEKEIEGRLASSLHNRILINLGKQAQPEQVQRLCDVQVKSGAITETIPPEMEILEVFDRLKIAGKLLILGKPGAGKTTTLLELARALVRRAINDPNEPMPFLLNLSSWKEPTQSIKDWTVKELSRIYSASMPWKKWLENHKLLPLFDELDEVRTQLQPACATAINQFLSSEAKLVPTVVCTRHEEYELYPEKLNLNGAIYLQELSDEQIERYLEEIDCASLWQVLATDMALLNLVRQPLLLSITLVAYREELSKQWKVLQTTQERVRFLLDIYIERMLDRRINSRMYAARKEPTVRQTQSWLIFLAKQLKQESQTDFLIERIQPSWLFSAKQHKIYGWCRGLIVGICLGLPSGAYYGWGIGAASLLIVFISVVLGSSQIIVPIHTLQWSSLKLKVFAILAPIGVAFGAISAFIHAIIIITTESVAAGIIVGLIATPVYSLIFLLCLLLFIGTVNPDLDINRLPNQGIFNSGQNSIILGTTAALILGVVFGVSSGFVSGLPGGVQTGLKFGLLGGLLGVSIGGGFACLEHFLLRLILFFNRSIPWNYARFLNYATDRMFLQRIGGRYRFIHKLLQDHFAQMEE
ncbi:NACHT domain-containing protein [Cyanobacteria bacterium FACHB-63]|nr:NACHT domain-containing protein [Cyanobacteria bacterium FACHB-63]